MSFWNTANRSTYQGSQGPPGSQGNQGSQGVAGSQGPLANANIFIGSNGVAFASAVTTSTGMSLPGTGTWALDTPQALGTQSSPSFTSAIIGTTMTISGNGITAANGFGLGINGANAGIINVNNGNNVGRLRLFNNTGAFYSGIRTGGLAASTEWILPTADAAGVMVSDGATNLSLSATPSVTSITLATTGGTQGALNYYETASISLSFMGIWGTSGTGSPQVVTAKISRVGVNVILMVPVVIAAVSTSAHITAATGSIPSRFCPVSTSYYEQIFVINNSATTLGSVMVATDGSLDITINTAANVCIQSFTAAGNGGFQPFAAKWLAL